VYDPNFNENDKLSDFHKKRIGNAIAARDKVMETKEDCEDETISRSNKVVVKTSMQRAVHLTILHNCETKFHGLMRKVEVKDGTTVTKPSVQMSEKFRDILTSQLVSFMVDVLHASKIMSANAGVMTVRGRDVESVFKGNAFLNNLSSFDDTRKEIGIEDVSRLIEKAKNKSIRERHARKVARLENEKVKKANREKEEKIAAALASKTENDDDED